MVDKNFAHKLFNLANRVAFVTGAGSGIGQMIAVGMASAGAKVVCFDLRDDGGLTKTINNIRDIGGEAFSFTGDVTNPYDLSKVILQIEAEYGKLDIAVNAAGIANANTALEMSVEQWQRVIDVNLTGVWNSCKAEAELMLKNGGGTIVNIASMSGSIVNRGLDQAHYNCSKAAVINLTKSLAVEWAGSHIRVNSLSPRVYSDSNEYPSRNGSPDQRV